jgi:hypothetical protein
MHTSDASEQRQSAERAGSAAAPTHEREIVEPMLECTPRGALNRDAVGWSRHPLHVCNLRGHPARKKRWEYWCVSARDHLVAITIADVDYAGLAAVSILEHAKTPARLVERVALSPFARGFDLPQSVRGGSVRAHAMGLRVAIDEEDSVTRLRASFARRGGDVRVEIDVDRAGESVSVLVPWSDRRFQYTSKHVALRARGHVTIGARRLAFGADEDAFACLDFGRGVWPYRTRWNWAAAAGRCARGRAIGLNMGGRWTDGTGITENALFVDGRVHKIGDDVVFDLDRSDPMRPWRIASRRGGRVDLVFVPLHPRTVHVPLGIVSTKLQWALGRFEGTISTNEGERVQLCGVRGWAEDHRARW